MAVMDTDRTHNSDRLLRAGEWLRAARKERGLTAADLASALGTTPQTISNYERGASGVNDEKAAQIAVVFDLGEIEVRRNLGLYVPGGMEDPVRPPTPVDTLAAIRRDAGLLPEARKHLMNQYKLLLRVEPVKASTEQTRAEIEAEMRADIEADLKARRREQGPDYDGTTGAKRPR